ncbi:unnamed protein product [Triticum turgidum subsp. durum]|uniref:Uncharacterized protein n=1 Tax=Triticum turgidum subsp. durum TaxID=4567 RepID=A0A9R1NRR5_TRITD|nr:unnamed protein product [Triticum turgidum subsp. durum]
MSRWKENIYPAPPHYGSSSNPSRLLPCKRPLQSPCPPPRRPLADVTGNALQQPGSAGGVEDIDYGYITPLPKVPKSCGFLLEDDDMDEAFLLEVDAICEEHSRSMAGKDKGREKDLTVERGPVVVAAATHAGPVCGTLEDAFWTEAYAIFEECDAQRAAKSQDEELKEMVEVESSVLSCGDDSLLPAISIADDCVKLEDTFWEVNAISKEHHVASSEMNQEHYVASSAINQDEIDEMYVEDGSVALCVDFPPVISIAEAGGEVVDALLGEVDVIHEGQVAMSAAKGKEEPGEMGLEMEENEGCAPRKYYEYLHSLNDKQREAACSDVAVPLMIVAGPGSGKTGNMYNYNVINSFHKIGFPKFDIQKVN